MFELNCLLKIWQCVFTRLYHSFRVADKPTTLPVCGFPHVETLCRNEKSFRSLPSSIIIYRQPNKTNHSNRYYTGINYRRLRTRLCREWFLWKPDIAWCRYCTNLMVLNVSISVFRFRPVWGTVLRRPVGVVRRPWHTLLLAELMVSVSFLILYANQCSDVDRHRTRVCNRHKV